MMALLLDSLCSHPTLLPGTHADSKGFLVRATSVLVTLGGPTPVLTLIPVAIAPMTQTCCGCVHC